MGCSKSSGLVVGSLLRNIHDVPRANGDAVQHTNANFLQSRRSRQPCQPIRPAITSAAEAIQRARIGSVVGSEWRGRLVGRIRTGRCAQGIPLPQWGKWVLKGMLRWLYLPSTSGPSQAVWQKPERRSHYEHNIITISSQIRAHD